VLTYPVLCMDFCDYVYCLSKSYCGILQIPLGRPSRRREDNIKMDLRK
jgi:hypothetical protein